MQEDGAAEAASAPTPAPTPAPPPLVVDAGNDAGSAVLLPLPPAAPAVLPSPRTRDEHAELSLFLRGAVERPSLAFVTRQVSPVGSGDEDEWSSSGDDERGVHYHRHHTHPSLHAYSNVTVYMPGDTPRARRRVRTTPPPDSTSPKAAGVAETETPAEAAATAEAAPDTTVVIEADGVNLVAEAGSEGEEEEEDEEEEDEEEAEVAEEEAVEMWGGFDRVAALVSLKMRLRQIAVITKAKVKANKATAEAVEVATAAHPPAIATDAGENEAADAAVAQQPTRDAVVPAHGADALVDDAASSNAAACNSDTDDDEKHSASATAVQPPVEEVEEVASPVAAEDAPSSSSSSSPPPPPLADDASALAPPPPRPRRASLFALRERHERHWSTTSPPRTSAARRPLPTMAELLALQDEPQQQAGVRALRAAGGSSAHKRRMSYSPADAIKFARLRDLHQRAAGRLGAVAAIDAVVAKVSKGATATLHDAMASRPSSGVSAAAAAAAVAPDEEPAASALPQSAAPEHAAGLSAAPTIDGLVADDLERRMGRSMRVFARQMERADEAVVRATALRAQAEAAAADSELERSDSAKSGRSSASGSRSGSRWASRTPSRRASRRSSRSASRVGSCIASRRGSGDEAVAAESSHNGAPTVAEEGEEDNGDDDGRGACVSQNKAELLRRLCELSGRDRGSSGASTSTDIVTRQSSGTADDDSPEHSELRPLAGIHDADPSARSEEVSPPTAHHHHASRVAGPWEADADDAALVGDAAGPSSRPAAPPKKSAAKATSVSPRRRRVVAPPAESSAAPSPLSSACVVGSSLPVPSRRPPLHPAPVRPPRPLKRAPQPLPGVSAESQQSILRARSLLRQQPVPPSLRRLALPPTAAVFPLQAIVTSRVIFPFTTPDPRTAVAFADAPPPLVVLPRGLHERQRELATAQRRAAEELERARLEEEALTALVSATARERQRIYSGRDVCIDDDDDNDDKVAAREDKEAVMSTLVAKIAAAAAVRGQSGGGVPTFANLVDRHSRPAIVSPLTSSSARRSREGTHAAAAGGTAAGEVSSAPRVAGAGVIATHTTSMFPAFAQLPHSPVYTFAGGARGRLEYPAPPGVHDLRFAYAPDVGRTTDFRSQKARVAKKERLLRRRRRARARAEHSWLRSQ